MRAVGLLLGGLVLALAPAGTLLPQAAASPAGLDVSHTRAFTQAAMETQVLALTNKQRRRHGCRPLAMSSPLRRAASTAVPMLPPYLLKACRTSATVRTRLSVMVSTMIAAPPIP